MIAADNEKAPQDPYVNSIVKKDEPLTFQFYESEEYALTFQGKEPSELNFQKFLEYDKMQYGFILQRKWRF